MMARRSEEKELRSFLGRLLDGDEAPPPASLPDFTAVERTRENKASAPVEPARRRDLQGSVLAGLPDFTAAERARQKPTAAPIEPTRRRARRAPAVLLGTDDSGPAEWAVSSQQNPFVIALGSSGSGKTELLKVLALELQGSVPVTVLDFHGDLAVQGLKRITLGSAHGVNPLASGADSIEALRAVLDVTAPGLGHQQAQLLSEAVGEVLKRSAPKMADLAEELESHTLDREERGIARRLLGALQPVLKSPVFSAPPVQISELLEQGASLDLSKLPRQVQIVAASALLAQLIVALRALGEVSRPGALRCFLILDEASILRSEALTDPLANELRKFGLGFAITAQQTCKLSPSLVDNAATVAVFRLQHRAEARRASRMLPSLADPDLLLQLAPRGECYFRDESGIRRVRILAANRRTREQP